MDRGDELGQQLGADRCLMPGALSLPALRLCDAISGAFLPCSPITSDARGGGGGWGERGEEEKTSEATRERESARVTHSSVPGAGPPLSSSERRITDRSQTGHGPDGVWPDGNEPSRRFVQMESPWRGRPLETRSCPLLSLLGAPGRPLQSGSCSPSPLWGSPRFTAHSGGRDLKTTWVRWDGEPNRGLHLGKLSPLRASLPREMSPCVRVTTVSSCYSFVASRPMKVHTVA